MNAEIAQISKEVARDFAAELEARFFSGRGGGSAFDGTQNTDADLETTGKMISSIWDLTEIMQEGQDCGYRMGSLVDEPSFGWKIGRAQLRVDTMIGVWQKRMLRQWIIDERASIMRRRADIDPELLRTAEIRALINPS